MYIVLIFDVGCVEFLQGVLDKGFALENEFVHAPSRSAIVDGRTADGMTEEAF